MRHEFTSLAALGSALGKRAPDSWCAIVSAYQAMIFLVLGSLVSRSWRALRPRAPPSAAQARPPGQAGILHGGWWRGAGAMHTPCLSRKAAQVASGPRRQALAGAGLRARHTSHTRLPRPTSSMRTPPAAQKETSRSPARVWKRPPAALRAARRSPTAGWTTGGRWLALHRAPAAANAPPSPFSCTRPHSFEISF